MTRALWRLWSASVVFFLSFFLLLGALPVYLRDAGLGDAAIGIVIGAFAAASMLTKPVAGWAADRFGRRPLLLAGAARFVVAPPLYLAAAGVVALVGVRLLHGLGMGLYPTAASTMAADAAPAARRGEVLGLFGAAASLALAVGPLAGTVLAARLGYSALFAAALACAALALALCAGVPESRPATAPGPFRLAASLSRGAVHPASIALLAMGIYGALVAFLPLHAATGGLEAGPFFLVYAVVLTAVRSPAGRLADRAGRRPVAAAGLALTAVAVAVLAAVPGQAGLLAGGALYGAAFGTAQSALVAWCVDTAAPAERGRTMATFQMAVELGIAAGSAGAGLVVAAAGFTATFAAAAVVAAVAAVLVYVPPPGARRAGPPAPR
jgi:MFS family permease